MKPSNTAQNNKTQLLLGSINKRFKSHYAAGEFVQALAQCLQATRIMPTIAEAWSDAAVCCVKLERWDEAIDHGLRAARLQPQTMAAYDALAHAYGGKGQLEEVRRWGLAALGSRMRGVRAELPIEHVAAALPPPPSQATRAHNIIAFSLFGGAPKYCECAVLNVSERESIYPDWTCRFYVDDSVPAPVIQRLKVDGSEVIRVSADQQTRWPGPMWRFMAYDTPGLHRVIFRDADSVINSREARAVDEWIASGRHFHLMRDSPTHTELILAGMWGVTAGALPSMTALVDYFLAKPVLNAHFADQLFLREWVWPYARGSLIQHDGVFGLLDAQMFPDGPMPVDTYRRVGAAEAASQFWTPVSAPDGTSVRWTLYRCAAAVEPRAGDEICSYPAIVHQGAVVEHLPHRYTDELSAGRMSIKVRVDPR